MKIYVASSWRNDMQQSVVAAMREAGHEVYDFKNPRPGDHGFHWSEIDPNWKQWTPEQFREALAHPIAEAGFGSDWNAMLEADAGVLVLPCGRSAHLEAGYFVGAGKPLVILLAPGEPELMYKMATAICLTVTEVVEVLKRHVCRVCGCTDARACCGGCFWVEPGLCSQCAGFPPVEEVP